MAITLYAGTFRAHPSGAIEVTAYRKPPYGGEVNIYLTDDAIRQLRDTFAFASKHGCSLGHANWHIREGEPSENCPLCSVRRLAED